MISVVIVDDQALIRTAVSQLITQEPDFTVAGVAADGAEAVRMVRSLRPDLVLMDIRMPVMDGIDATRAIRRDPELQATRVVILTTFEDDEYVLQALRMGASGFVSKGSDADHLMQALHTVHNGEALLSPHATKVLIDRYARPAPAANHNLSPELAVLTDREREILHLVASGLSTTDIAKRLTISPQTAKTHINRTMTKLQAHDRAQLVIIAYESGLLVPGRLR